MFLSTKLAAALAFLISILSATGVAVDAPANLLVNPGLETVVTPWVPRGPEVLAISTPAHTGVGAVLVTNRSAAWQGAAQSMLGRMRPGGSYVCSVWARSESATAQVLKLTFAQTDGAGTRFISVANAAVTSSVWTFLSGTFSLNVTGTLEDLVLYVEGPAAGVNLRVDDAAVVPLSGFRLAAAQRSVLIGGISGSSVNTDLPFGRIAGSDYHIAGTENALKFASLHTALNTYSFSGADTILDHATAHGQLSRGHALLWHGSVPTWLSSGTWTPSQLLGIAFDHIDTVVGRYRDRLFCWDVVNEAFNDNGTLRSTIWYDAPGIGYAGQGTKYIEEALIRARAADADCELFYNDYSAETVNAKSDAIYAMASDFKTRGVPLDGIGFQFHLSGTPSLSSMRTNFQRFNDLGLTLHLTELDVRVAVDANGVATAAALAAQADTYFAVVGTALAFPRTRVVQTWGFSDRYSWIPGFAPGFGAALPVDENLARKPAWWALRDVLANQCESVAVVATSAGDTSAVISNTAFSAGSARQLQANAAGDFITLATSVLYPGEYNVRIGVRKNSASGQFQLAATATPGGAFVNIGAVQETYAATTAYTELNLGTFTFTSAGTNALRFTVAGKSASSTDFDLVLDYVRLTPTGVEGNQTPEIPAIADQLVTGGGNLGPLPFVVSDRETLESALTVTATSSNPALIPTANLALTGGGQERVLVATPLPYQSGVATVTITASDGTLSTSRSFLVTVISDLQSTTGNIATSADDAEQSAAGAVNLTSTDLELVNDGALGNQIVGMRFTGLAIPPGAIITDARLQFKTDEAQSEATVLDIAGVAADDAPVFTTAANNLGSRALTPTSVLWQPAAWNTVGEAGALQRTPNLAATVQEIVARPGWASGHALAILIKGTGHRTAESFDKAGGVPPVLTVIFRTTPPGSFTTWMSGYPSLSGASAQPTANPDGDAFSNLLEYALATSPAQTNVAPYILSSSNGQLVLTYTRPSIATDLTYFVEWSDTLAAGTWSTSGVAQQVLTDDGTTRTIRAYMDAGIVGKRFMRVRVTAP